MVFRDECYSRWLYVVDISIDARLGRCTPQRFNDNNEEQSNFRTKQKYRAHKIPGLNASLLAPAFNLFGQFFPLVLYELHHGLDLLTERSIVPIIRIGWSDICVINGYHQIHHRRQLIWKPLSHVSTHCLLVI